MIVSTTRARARPRPVAATRPLGDLLSQASVLTVIALSLATIAFCGYRLGVHYGAWSALGTSARTVAATVAAPLRAAVMPAKAGAGNSDPNVDNNDLSALGPVPGVSQPAVLRNGTWVPILMYHYVRNVSKEHDRMGWNLSVTPRDFEAQMRYLRDAGYTSMTMRELDIAIAQKRALPPRPVVVTFDDAYRDFYTTAAPILRDMGIRATEYVPTQLVGKPAYMTWSQIQELDAEGFEMAAHTQLHVDLTKQTTTRALIEIEGSKSMLEDRLGHPVVDFAYPSGAFNLAVMEQVREAGFWSAVTTQNGGYHDFSQMFDESRVRVSGGETVEEFGLSLRPSLPSEVQPSADAGPRLRIPTPTLLRPSPRPYSGSSPTPH